MKTLYTKYQELKDSENGVNLLRFYFKNIIRYSSPKVTKAKDGVYVKDNYSKIYAEISFCGKFIHTYPVKNGKIGECNGEVVIEVFEKTLKSCHDLLNM